MAALNRSPLISSNIKPGALTALAAAEVEAEDATAAPLGLAVEAAGEGREGSDAEAVVGTEWEAAAGLGLIEACEDELVFDLALAVSAALKSSLLAATVTGTGPSFFPGSRRAFLSLAEHKRMDRGRNWQWTSLTRSAREPRQRHH